MENPVTVSSPEVSFARLACVVRLTALQAEVESLLHLSQVAETWVDHVNKNDYRDCSIKLSSPAQQQFTCYSFQLARRSQQSLFFICRTMVQRCCRVACQNLNLPVCFLKHRC